MLGWDLLMAATERSGAVLLPIAGGVVLHALRQPAALSTPSYTLRFRQMTECLRQRPYSDAQPPHPPAAHPKEAYPMLKYAIIFAIISLIAGALGFTGVAAGSAAIAKVLFVVFLVLAVLFVVLALLGIGAARKAIK